MKQNCRDPESRIVRSTSDSTSSCAAPPVSADSGLSIKSSRNPAKDALSPAVRTRARHRKHQSPLEDTTMASGTNKLVIVVTKGIDSELSSVAFTIANGGLTAGLQGLDVPDQRRGRSRPPRRPALTQVAAARAARRIDRGFPEARRRHLGVPALRQVARLRTGRSARRRHHHRRQRHARRNQGGGGDAVVLNRRGILVGVRSKRRDGMPAAGRNSARSARAIFRGRGRAGS